MLSRILVMISRPFAAVGQWIGNLLGHGAPRASQTAPSPQALPVSATEFKKVQQFALKEAPDDLAKVDPLVDVLRERFGPLAGQYLAKPKNGQAPVFSDGEVMAIGLYTNGGAQSLNNALRAGKKLNQGQSAVVEGLSSAFGRADADKLVVKTFRGTYGGDAFSDVAEGQKGRDAGYLSTSMNTQTAKNFSRDSTHSTVFGKSGLDVSTISIEVDEQEILYNRDTEMTVLFSAKDSQGMTMRVLEESALSADSGRQKGLFDALDLPVAP